MRRTLAIAAVLVVGPLVAALPAAGKSANQPGFGKPVFLDQQLAGGEPFVIYSHVGHDLIYSSHEGTTHLFRDGVIEAPAGTASFADHYRNQVNIWTSSTDGQTWNRVNFHGTGFFTSPHYNTGFSDPDLTEDEGGVIYDTGIDLVNDALFSTPDGGKTWPSGTLNCHAGDRPWLAGGHKNEVFLATDTNAGGHTIYRSTNAGKSCGSFGIQDFGKNYTGYGKLYYDHSSGILVDPVKFSGSNGTSAVGVGVLANASHAFDTQIGKFVVHQAATTDDMIGSWPAIAIDKAGTIYETWTPDPRTAGTKGGCNGAATPKANSVMLTWSTDHGVTWAKPLTLTHPGTTVLWPWVQAGNAGAVSVVWYQYDRVTDPDCGSGNVSAYDANIFNATDPSKRTIAIANIAGRPIHSGGICQQGTTCVATGQDRRLGDYFTNALDANGCIMVATGDTTTLDPITHQQLPTSRPLFIRQDKGRGLYGKPCVAAASEASGTPVAAPHSSNGGGSLATTGLPVAASAFAAFLVAAGLVVRRRMRRTG
jgi:hypothetical protein